MQGHIKIMIVSIVLVTLVSLPVLIYTNEINKLTDAWRISVLVLWLLLINLVILFSSKIVLKFWKK